MLTLKDVNTIHSRGLIPGSRYLEAASLIRDDAAWATWAARAILAIGVAHLLAGIASFFAYNWADMPAFVKFAIVEAGIVIAAGAAWFAGIARPAGQALLSGASILVGVLLAVIGQVYHTDADAFSLFAAWMLLILPWTVASRSAAHWGVWLLVTYLALRLYGEQALIPDGRITSTTLEVALGALFGLALAAREFAVHRGAVWLAAAWTRLTPLVAGLALLFWPAAAYMVDNQGEALAPAAFLIAIAVAAFAYRRWLPDFAASTAIIGFTAIFVIALGYRIIDEAVGFDWSSDSRLTLSLGLLVPWSAAAMGVAAKLLQVLHRQRHLQPS